MDTLDRDLPLFPLGQVVLFPGMLLRLHIFEERYKALIGRCHVAEQPFGVLLIRSGREVGPPAEPERVGCTARILELERLPEGRMNIVAIGEQRFTLLTDPAPAEDGFLLARVRLVTREDAPSVPLTLMQAVATQLELYVNAVTSIAGAEALNDVPVLASDSVTLSFRVGAALKIRPRERQKLLETDDALDRLTRELALLGRELPRIRRDARIARAVQASPPPEAKSIGPFSLN